MFEHIIPIIPGIYYIVQYGPASIKQETPIISRLASIASLCAQTSTIIMVVCLMCSFLCFGLRESDFFLFHVPHLYSKSLIPNIGCFISEAWFCGDRGGDILVQSCLCFNGWFLIHSRHSNHHVSYVAAAWGYAFLTPLLLNLIGAFEHRFLHA